MNNKHLLKTLVGALTFDDLRNLAYQLDCPPKNWNSPDEIARDIVDYVNTRKRQDELIGILQDSFPHVNLKDIKVTAKGSVTDARLQRHPEFSNRVDEIKMITSSRAPAYTLLDAPAGYGKSALIEQLPHYFAENERWLTAIVEIKEHSKFHNIIGQLAQRLSIRIPVNINSIIETLGLEFAASLRRTHLDNDPRGLLLLFDFQGKPSADILGILLNEFIPSVQKSLRNLEFFEKQHNRFRVIIAGRYLAGSNTFKRSRMLSSFNVQELSPFDYGVIVESARNYLINQEEKVVSQISAHISHTTAGHPGCVMQALQKYEEEALPPNEFIEIHERGIWTEFLDPAIRIVKQSIPSDLSKLIEDLSIFRYLNYQILASLISEGFVQVASLDEFELADKLTATYLMSWNGRLLGNGITRRLLCLALQHTMSDGEFADRCLHAQRLYLSLLQDTTIQMPETWAMEYMFQGLQRFAPKIHLDSTRAIARTTFFKSDLPNALRSLTKDRETRIELNALIKTIDENTEFQFVLNYFLRNENYNTQPYEDLYRFIIDYTEVEPEPESLSVALAPISTKININSASVDELLALPSIGRARALRIVEYREQNGMFKEVYSLENVRGIGKQIIAKLSHLISIKAD